MKVIPETRRVD